VIFDTHMWGMAFGWAFGTALIVALLTFLSPTKEKTRSRWDDEGPTFKVTYATKIVSVSLVAFVVDLLAMRIAIYYGNISIVGTFGGYGGLLLISLIAAGAGAATATLMGGGKTLAIGCSTFALLLICGALCQYMFECWGTSNKREFAKLANIHVASNTENLPPTDQNHIVMVTQAVAAYKGSSAISKGGENWGSIYKTEDADYTLQSVAGHLYWVAPIVYAKIWSQVGFIAEKFADTPGFIAVDAEDPNSEPERHITDKEGQPLHMRYLPDAVFMQNLTRYVYMAGYTDGILEDPTLEVDDNWRPFYTITYLQYAFGVAGKKLDKVLIVDAQTGKIDAYEPAKVPTWVDRVMSYDLVKEYATDWGNWSDLNSTFPNWSGQYQKSPVDLEFHYNSIDKPVWVVPFINESGNKNATPGILVYDTHDNSGTFYPGLAGRNVGDKITAAFHDTQKNVNGRLVAASVQLYSIEGVPTWVCIYVNNSSFSGIGMLDAREPMNANVVIENDRKDVINDFRNYLADSNANKGDISNAGKTAKPITGVIDRISYPTTLNGKVTYFFNLNGNVHIFSVTLDHSDDLPLIHTGDRVTIEYLDTKEHLAAVRTFTPVR
jgi:hypothetical protein